MPELTEPSTAVAPKPLRTARVIMYVQGAASLLISAVQVLDVLSRTQHNQEVSGLAYLAAFADPLVALLLLMSAALVVSRRTWVLPLAVVLESIGILSGVLNTISGYPQAMLAVLLSIMVIVLLRRREVRAWIDATPPGKYRPNTLEKATDQDRSPRT